jgi:hypothetical protein
MNPVFQQRKIDLRGVDGVATPVLTLLADDDSSAKKRWNCFGGISRL